MNLRKAATRLLDSLFLWLGSRIELSKRRLGMPERPSIKVDEIVVRPAAPVPAQPEYPVVTQSLNLTRRARAMHMRRRGDEPHTIAAALGIGYGELELLFKLDHLLQQQD